MCGRAWQILSWGRRVERRCGGSGVVLGQHVSQLSVKSVSLHSLTPFLLHITTLSMTVTRPARAGHVTRANERTLYVRCAMEGTCARYVRTVRTYRPSCVCRARWMASEMARWMEARVLHPSPAGASSCSPCPAGSYFPGQCAAHCAQCVSVCQRIVQSTDRGRRTVPSCGFTK
jgi:hypothetical protein